jgi:Ca2+-binding EF-hand superfamily protein
VPFTWEQEGVHEAPNTGPKQAIKAPAELAPKDQEVEQEAQTLFSHMDSDGSGKLSTAELEKGLTELGFPISEVTEIMSRADLNKDNQLSFDEFRLGVVPLLRERQGLDPLPDAPAHELTEEEQQAKTLFSHMDSDGSGKLSTAELEKGLTELGFSLSEISEIMDRADRDGDHQVLCVCVCVCVCTYVCITYIRMYIHTYNTYIHTYMYIYIHTHTRARSCHSTNSASAWCHYCGSVRALILSPTRLPHLPGHWRKRISPWCRGRINANFPGGQQCHL